MYVFITILHIYIYIYKYIDFYMCTVFIYNLQIQTNLNFKMILRTCDPVIYKLEDSTHNPILVRLNINLEG